MDDIDKTKEQLIVELAGLRRRFTELKATETELANTRETLQAEISEYKQTEDALRESKERLKLALDAVTDGLFDWNLQTGDVYFSPRYYTMLGYEPGEVFASYETWISLIHLEDRDRVLKGIQEIVEQKRMGHELEYRIRTIAGSDCWVLSRIKVASRDADGRPIRLVGTHVDITAYKQMEETLKATERRLRSLIEQTTDAVFCYEFDPPIPTDLPVEEQVRRMYNCTLVECNDASARSYGAARAEDVIGRQLTDLFGTIPGSLDKLFTAMVQEGYRIVDGLGIEELPDGTKRYFLNNGYGVVEEGKLLRVWGTFRDITLQRKTEGRLRMLSSAVEQSANAVAIVDRGGTVEYVNRTFLERNEFSPEEIVGKNWRSFLSEHSTLREKYAEIYHVVMERGMTWRGVVMDKARSGDIIWRDATLFPIEGAEGETTHTVYISEDITERKRGEIALQASEEKFRTLAEQSPNMIFINKLGRVIYANARCEHILGYTKDELYSPEFRFLDLIAPEYYEEIETAFAQHMRGEEVEPYEYVLIARDGTRIAVVNASRLIDYEGQRAILGIVIDITERKRAEETLRESEERLKILFEFAPDAYYMINLKGDFIDGNKAAEELVGYDRSELIGKSFLKSNLLPLGQIPRAAALLARNAQGQATGPDEFILNRRDGSQVPVEIRTFPVQIQGEAMVLGIARDISERKQMEQAYRALVDNSLQGLNIVQDGRIVFANQALAEMSGYTIEELLNLSPVEVQALIHPDDREFVLERARQRLAGGQVPEQYEFRFIRRDGTQRWVEQHTGLIEYEGKPAAQTAYVDITQRKRAEEAEHEQRAFAMALVDTAEAVSSTLDFDEVLQRILSAIADVVPHDGANIMLVDDDQIGVYVVRSCDCYTTHGLEKPKNNVVRQLAKLPHLQQMFESGTALAIPDTKRHTEWAKSETETKVRSYVGVPIVIEDQVIGFLNVGSVTPDFYGEKHAERLKAFANQAAIALQNAQMFRRLASYSEDLERAVAERTAELASANAELEKLSRAKDEFVSNVSHELRTPITGMVLRQHLLRRQPEQLDKHLGVIERETRRLEHTIEDLLRLSRLDQDRTEVELVPVDLNQLVAQFVADRTLPAEQQGLSLMFEGQADLPMVVADQGLLGQALSILLTNALNYTPAGGQVRVSTQTQPFGDQQWAGFSVSDTGPGIAPDEQERLFERFFRGKAGRESHAPGTGLGLAIAKEIVDRHKGRITVESDGIPGQGASFSVWLPAAEETHGETTADR